MSDSCLNFQQHRAGGVCQNAHNGSFHISGRDINLLKVLSDKLNFRVNFSDIRDYGNVFENGTANGPLKALIDGYADISISDLWLKTNRLKFLDCSNPYFTDQTIFITPHGVSWTLVEKLIFPFAVVVWVFIFVCFLVVFIIIAVVERRSLAVQNFVFGTDVRSPHLNMFRGFIGGSQNILPRRNFARFLLSMFLIYSMVIRTAYQASYFHLNSDKKHKRVTIDAIILNQDYLIYAPEPIADVFTGTDALRKRFN